MQCKYYGKEIAEDSVFCQYCGAPLNEQSMSLSTKVTEEEIADGVKDEYGVVYSRDGKRLLRGWQLAKSKYTIKNGTKTICDWAFNDCKSLESIELPDGLTSIREGAFWGYEGLKTISLPNRVTEIGQGAFRGCDQLEKIRIRSVWTAIEDSVIAKFKKLLPNWLHNKIEIERTKVNKLFNTVIEFGLEVLEMCVVVILLFIIALVIIILVGGLHHFGQDKFVAFIILGGFLVGAFGDFVRERFHRMIVRGKRGD